ncbi:MAG: hypothetical protein K2N35_07900 [Muribaculaceae bacterium]|nr:hypothetical protein [Muribaculaceae bacterium]
MTYKELMALNAKQEEILAKRNCNPSITIKEQHEPIYHFVVKEEHNNFGDNHMNNVDWILFDDNDEERLCLWYTQFCGPFYWGDKFIDGKITLLNGEVFLIGSLTSDEVKKLLDGRRFRLEFRNIYCRLRNIHNLKAISEKKEVIALIESLNPEEQNKYLDYNGQCIDFFEV